MTVMRKFIPPPLAEHYRSPAVTVTNIMRIRAKTGHVYGFTDLDVDIEYDPAVYDPGNTGDDWGRVNHRALNGGFAMSRLMRPQTCPWTTRKCPSCRATHPSLRSS